MRKASLIAISLILLNPLTNLSAQDRSVGPLPIGTPVAEVTPTAAVVAPINLNAKCEVPTLSGYVKGMSKVVKLLLNQDGVTKVKVRVKAKASERKAPSSSVQVDNMILGLHPVKSDDGISYSVYANGLDNMMFTKCTRRYNFTISTSGEKAGAKVSGKTTSQVDLVGIYTARN